jgi:hypothetical protein
VLKLKTIIKLPVIAYVFLIKSFQKQPIISNLLKRYHLKRILVEIYDYKSKKNKNAINVAIILSNGLTRPTSSAFIRLISPLTNKAIAKKYNIKLFSEKINSIDSRYEVCIIQRAIYSNISDAKKLVSSLKKNGTILIIDSDDAFHDIDDGHNEYKHHFKKLESFNFLLKHADEIWLSTPQLKKIYDQYSYKVVVIPNTLDERLWQFNNNRHKTTDFHVNFVYMGTATHSKDFKLVLPALDILYKKYPGKFSLDIIGVTDNIINRDWLHIVHQTKGSLYPNFVKWYLEQGPYNYGLSPLVNSSFNLGKSDIKCLDYLAAGIVPVVSNIEPYKSKDIKNFIIRSYNDLMSLTKTLEDIINNKHTIDCELLDNATKYIWEKRSSSLTAKKIDERITSIKSLYKKS